MKTLTIIATILITFTAGFAQIGEIAFKEMEYDFGSVKEEDGPITHEFQFTNGTQAPVKILSVRASCGCTTPGWSKEEVSPGGTGFVKAQYNPYNRPGPFHKTLTVQTTLQKNIVLHIKGNVVPRVKTTEELYPVAIGDIRFRTTSFNVGRINPHEPVSREFEILNSGQKTVKFLEPANLPEHIRIKVPTEGIPAGEKSNIVVTYDAKIKNDYGFMIDDITLQTDEAQNSTKAIKVYANIDPYIPSMTGAERAMAPSLAMDKSIIDFGTISQGEKAENELKIKNTGKSTLEIIMAKPSCSCTSIEIPNQKVEPGEEVTLKIIFDSTGIRGNQQKYITLFSNDPSGPSKRVTLKGVVN